jgi:hypothetical protein
LRFFFLRFGAAEMVVEVRSAGNIGTLVLVVILKFPARVGLAVQLVLTRICILPASVSGRVYPLCCPPIIACSTLLPHGFLGRSLGGACWYPLLALEFSYE